MIDKIFNENNKITMNKIPDNYISGIITSPPMGIRTTARACKKANSNYIGSELDTEHYDIAIKLLK